MLLQVVSGQLLVVVLARRSAMFLGLTGAVSRFPFLWPHRQISSAWACRPRTVRPAAAPHWAWHFLHRYRCYSLLGFLGRVAQGPKAGRELFPW